MDPEVREKVVSVMRMQSKLQMNAWQALYNEMMMGNRPYYTDEEREFVTVANLETQKQYDHVDVMIEDLLNDEAGLLLMQAGMREHIEKMDRL